MHLTIQCCSFFTDMCLEWWNNYFLLHFIYVILSMYQQCQFYRFNFIFFCLRGVGISWTFSTLRFSTLLHNDHAAHQDHYGRCRICTRDLCPWSLLRYQWATTSQFYRFRAPNYFQILQPAGGVRTRAETASPRLSPPPRFDSSLGRDSWWWRTVHWSGTGPGGPPGQRKKLSKNRNGKTRRESLFILLEL